MLVILILFGDAPPNDDDLRPQVLSLAANVGAGISAASTFSIAGNIQTSEVTEGLALTEFSVSETDVETDTSIAIPVQIFTILIGSDPTTRDDFQSLADETGGQTFNAVDASEIVDALLEAIETPINTPPVVANPIADQIVDEDSLFSFSIPPETFADDGDVITLDAGLRDGAALPDWLSFDVDTNTFSGIPRNENVGSIEINVTATDSSGTSVSDLFVLTVTNTNDGPVVENPLPDKQLEAYRHFSFTVPSDTFLDVDGDRLALSATLENGDPLPTWLDFDATSNTFTGFPLGEDVGTVKIAVLADDGNDETVTSVFELDIALPLDETVNSITGTSSRNILLGKRTADFIDGQAGNDIILGRGGDDLLEGGTGRDFLVGHSGDDILDGGSGSDFIVGGSGNDLIIGNGGNNRLWGNSGSDQFALRPGSGVDYIYDFRDGIDTIILLDNLEFSDLSINSTIFNQVTISTGSDVLAKLWRVDVNLIDANDFHPVASE